MNNNNYRDYFDKIKCSPEFKAKMENLLSSADNAEYADSVSDVEHMPKVNVHRWTALAASATLILGLGGGVVFMLHNDQNDQIQFSVSNTHSEKITPQNENMPDFSELGIAELKFSGMSGVKSVTTLDFEELPQAANEAVLDNLSRGNWTEQESFDISDESVSLTLTWQDDYETEYTVYGSGNAVLSYNGEEHYFYIDNYYSLIGIISHYLPFCNWEKLVSGENGVRIAEIFKENLDSIEETPYDGYTYDYASCFFNGGPYSAYIDQKGVIVIEYPADHDVYRTVYFQAPYQMYMELCEALNISVEETPTSIAEPANADVSDSQKVYTKAESAFKDAKNVRFTTGGGQAENSCNFEVSDLDDLLKAVKSLNWKVKSANYIYGDQFIINDIIISKQGEIYLTESGILYSAEGQDLTMLTDALNKITESSDLENIAFMLASSKNNFATVSGNIYRSFSYNGVNIFGSGVAYWDKANTNEYIVIENGDNSYEFIMEHGYWTFIQRESSSEVSIENNGETVVTTENNSVSHTSGFRFYDTPLIDFEWTISDLQSILNQMIEFPDKIESMDIKRSSGGANADLIYRGDTGMYTQLTFSLDSHGMLTYMSKSVFSADSTLVSIEEFALDNCIYDSGYFVIPELTDEQKAYIEEAKS